MRKDDGMMGGMMGMGGDDGWDDEWVSSGEWVGGGRMK